MESDTRWLKRKQYSNMSDSRDVTENRIPSCQTRDT